MKHFIDTATGDVYGYEDNQLYLVKEGMREMTDDEFDRHKNPEKYLSDEEKVQLARKRMPTLSPIEFDLKLDASGLYDSVQTLIAGNRTLMIAYTRALYFSRTDPFIEEARIALGLTHEQVDTMWTS